MASQAEIDDAVFGPARGGRKPAAAGPLRVEIVRSLNESDLPALHAPPEASGTPTPATRELRHSHHQLARALAECKSIAEAAAITGYSLSRISVLKADPSFRTLLAHYTTNRDLVFIDAAERMKTVGLDALEILASRMQDDPGQFSDGKLMELVDLTLVKGRASPGASGIATGNGGVPAGGAPLVQISFIQPPEGLLAVAEAHARLLPPEPPG